MTVAFGNGGAAFGQSYGGSAGHYYNVAVGYTGIYGYAPSVTFTGADRHLYVAFVIDFFVDVHTSLLF